MCARACVGGARKVVHKRVGKNGRREEYCPYFFLRQWSYTAVNTRARVEFPSREYRIEYQMMEGHAVQESEGG